MYSNAMSRGEVKQQFLHKAEVSILKSLRLAEHARFSELMHPTGLTSDNFKFYLRNLVRLGWVKKSPDGDYALTSNGKELANNLDETRLTLQKQAKVSVLIVASRTGVTGEPEYAFQQRQRHPYYGFWGVLSGPVQWGEGVEEAAKMELRKQTGLLGECEVRAFCRITDYVSDGMLLEDKLFAVVLANHCRGLLDASWKGGRNAWMTLKELTHQAKHFEYTAAIIGLIESGKPYASFIGRYEPQDY
jgi:ADP-ribose pyrophosphatase YjhB (NUDIX family)/predicted transcriptional regulator